MVAPDDMVGNLLMSARMQALQKMSGAAAPIEQAAAPTVAEEVAPSNMANLMNRPKPSAIPDASQLSREEMMKMLERQSQGLK